MTEPLICVECGVGGETVAVDAHNIKQQPVHPGWAQCVRAVRDELDRVTAELNAAREWLAESCWALRNDVGSGRFYFECTQCLACAGEDVPVRERRHSPDCDVVEQLDSTRHDTGSQSDG